VTSCCPDFSTQFLMKALASARARAGVMVEGSPPQAGWTADEDRHAVAKRVACIVLDKPAYGLACCWQ
jgi:hypothetical protein